LGYIGVGKGVSHYAVEAWGWFILWFAWFELPAHDTHADEHGAGALGAGFIIVTLTPAVNTPGILVALGGMRSKVDAFAEHVAIAGSAHIETLSCDRHGKWSAMECLPNFRHSADFLFNGCLSRIEAGVNARVGYFAHLQRGWKQNQKLKYFSSSSLSLR
jgi:hypothetical protein